MTVLLAMDQGTTSSRCIAFERDGTTLATAQQEFPQHFPRDGWVEHDPEDIWRTSIGTLTAVLRDLGQPSAAIAGLGISNQRETTLLWDRCTGAPVYPAIVWQDRRTAGLCQELEQQGAAELVRQRTGLLLDPYFSATKLAWILDNVEGCRGRAEAGHLAFGTVDTFLLWRLSGGTRHATDASNASRTMLFNIHTQEWDDELLALFRIPAAVLPQVLDSSADFGVIAAGLPGEGISVAGIAGDQQAALIGQGCLRAGEAKSTYGTGCFLVLNTGDEPVYSSNRLLTTVAYRLDGRTTYAMEGSIFVAGAAVQWLRDTLGMVVSAAETELIAAAANGNAGVYVVPAFTGLGAPHWNPHARGAILGLSRDSGVAAIVTATLQSVAYQTRDLLDAMARDGTRLAMLRVDGGMAANNWLLQFMADMLGMTVSRPRVTEATALGAASLAGLRQGVLATLDDLPRACGEDRRFEPSMAAAERESLYAGWQDAIARVMR